MKKKTQGYLLLASAISMYAFNHYIEKDATKKNLLKDDKGSYYNWKLGKIYYTREGNGSPVLLIHDIQPSSSSYEWKKTIHRLQKTHTVYTLDLLGCGRSDKPEIVYTTYMYVQLITSFVKNVIKEKTDVVASNLSSSFLLMTDQMDDSLFRNIIMINPPSIRQMQTTTTGISRLKKQIVNLPLFGTFIYNINMRPAIMDLTFRKRYSSDIKTIAQDVIDTYYESAHLDKNKGKYLYSSILGNYMNFDIYPTVKKMNKPVYIIYSDKLRKSIPSIAEYHKINNRIITKPLTSGSPYPQIEDSQKVCNAIRSII